MTPQAGRERDAARAYEGFEVGAYFWWTYSQDYPIAKAWDNPCQLTVIDDAGNFEAFDFETFKSVSASVTSMAGKVRPSTRDEVIEYLERQAHRLAGRAIEHEQKARRLRSEQSAVEEKVAALSTEGAQ